MCAWLLTGPHTPEAASASLTTTATNAGATATLQKLEQDLQRVQAEIDACNKDLKEAVFERVLEKYGQELEKRSQELTTVKDSLAELDAAAEELQLDLPGNKERQAAVRKNKLARKKQENRREALEDSIANLRAGMTWTEAAIADLRANQKDARSDLAARRKDMHHQLHRLEEQEKRIREQMEKAAAAQPGQPGIFFRLTCSRKMNMRVCLRPFSPWSCIRSPMRLLSFVAFSLSTPPPTFDLSPSLFYFFPQQGFQSLQLGGPLTENQLCTKLCSG